MLSRRSAAALAAVVSLMQLNISRIAARLPVSVCILVDAGNMTAPTLVQCLAANGIMARTPHTANDVCGP